MKNILKAKSINNDKRNSINIVQERAYSSFDLVTGMEEDVVNDGAFQLAPQFFNDVKNWAVRRQKYQVQPGIFLKELGQ